MKGRYLGGLSVSTMTKRLGAVAAIVLVAGGLALLGMRGHGSDAIPHSSTVAKSPSMSTMAGGTNHYPAMDAMVAGQDARDNRSAARARRSYTAAIVGDGAVSELGDKPTAGGTPAVAATAPSRSTPPPPTGTVTNPFSSTATRPAATPATWTAPTTTTTTPPPPDRHAGSPHGALPEAVAIELLQAWAPQAPQTDRIASEQETDTGGTPNDRATARGTTGTLAAKASTTASGSTLAARADKTLLLEAGHGVFARNVLAVSSDSNGPVVVEVESGPFVGARMTGSFERKDERLVVSLKSLAIGESDPIAVDAIAVAPDTMETAVASTVDEHYVTRVILPTAAAFVQGLGQALAQSNSTSVLSPLGGTTSTTKLNFSEQLGVAAGAAGQQVGQILQKAAPTGPTVTLDKDASLGVVFLKPVYANN